MTGSTTNPELLPPETPGEPGSPHPSAAWKAEISARVRAHRNRSRVPANQPTLPGMEEAFSPASIAARVAERYARLPSWREMLQAQAAAKSTVDSLLAAAQPPAEPEPVPLAMIAAPSEPEAQPVPEPYQPDLLRYSVSTDSLPAPRSVPPQARAVPSAAEVPSETSFLDPLEEATVEPAQPLPATLITSPRELVAPRKARPRLAEGPLRDDPRRADDAPEFAPVAGQRPPVAESPAEDTELLSPPSDSETRSQAPDASSPAAPEWHSIHLDMEAPMREPKPSSSLADEATLPVAPLRDRALAALVDCALTLCAFLLFSAVFAICSTSLPHGRIALIGAGATLFAMGLLYQILFFTLTDATPGMRYARIALCTFDNENPGSSALRGRIAALLLSALPLGLGFLWAVFDEDSLGWHDRMTRTYQRRYANE